MTRPARTPDQQRWAVSVTVTVAVLVTWAVLACLILGRGMPT